MMKALIFDGKIRLEKIVLIPKGFLSIKPLRLSKQHTRKKTSRSF